MVAVGWIEHAKPSVGGSIQDQRHPQPAGRPGQSKEQPIPRQTLTVLAGRRALAILRRDGLSAQALRVITGASGGPKWFVLYGLDRALWGEFLRDAPEPLHLVGSSSGSWRFACAARDDPLTALQRFADSYVAQCYPPRPSPADVTGTARGTLDEVLGEAGAAEIAANPRRRLHLLAARLRGTDERSGVLLPRLGAAAALNAVSRRALGVFVERALFHAGGEAGPLARWRDLPTRHLELTAGNLAAALLASGSIPGVMEPVNSIPGAPAGLYCDGGITDYHIDSSFDLVPGELVLQPHFHRRVVPGWFDKALPWRGNSRDKLADTVLLAPSPEFVAALPGGRIPDRHDFKRLDDATRQRDWRKVLGESERLGEEFLELVRTGEIARVAQPM